ncbi:MAG: DoxX family membrane protein [Anaerolineae bacterium]|nr:DoxX family membrane protein [Phycisphaerae bacterium]
MFIAAGAWHFVNPEFYRLIIPPMFPAPAALVIISGIAEIAGGIGILIPRLRRIAGWGLIALLIAVYPANIYMAVAPEKIPNLTAPQWALWARLPLQLALAAVVWFVALYPKRSAARKNLNHVVGSSHPPMS